jgi:3',5'-cyclic AMP phosphodiesterase CpdA
MRVRISFNPRFLGLLTFLFVSVVGGIVQAQEPSESIRMILVSDTHVRLEVKDPENMYPSDNSANDRNRFVVSQINQLERDLVIHLGDICHSIPALPTHEQVVRNSRAIYGGVEGEFYAAPGNHDIGDKPNAFAASPIVTEATHEMFLKYWGPTYQSFDRGNIHFVLLNTPALNSGLPIEGEQKEWLEADLERSHQAGKRIFFFTHFPPFITSPDENEHYDNLGQPARSWLLSLLEKYEVEAWFCGHSHNVFYNRYKKTHIYILPSTVFVRPDFSEMFFIGPENEYGRFDNNKLGFMMVHIDPDGHRIQYIPTYGATEDNDERPVTIPQSLIPGDRPVAAAPVGVSLRHSWARPVAKPFDSLDEFGRKLVRNDYLLKGLWGLNIRKLRVPLGVVA